LISDAPPLRPRYARLMTAEVNRTVNLEPQLLQPVGPLVRPSWSDGWHLDSDAAILRGVVWCRGGLHAAMSRVWSAKDAAFDHWAAAVEDVWWAVALDDVLCSLHDGRYLIARSTHLDGEIVLGLRWLRHPHAHQIAVTGQGGPKRAFFGVSGGPLFYISPSNRWKQRSEFRTDNRRPDKNAEAAYDAHIAGRTLDEPVISSLRWFDLILTAAGVDPLQDVHENDPTVL